MADDVTMSPNDVDSLHAAVDYRIDHVWDALNHTLDGRIEDDEAFHTIAGALYAAYIHGYHDGSDLYDACIDGDLEGCQDRKIRDELDLDLRLADIWARTDLEALPEPLDVAFRHVLYLSYIAGWQDGHYERPFGPAPKDNPDSLHIEI
jgi:hypothetical protein